MELTGGDGYNASFLRETRSDFNVFVVIISVLIFLGFKNLKIKYNAGINLLASAVFGVYRTHKHFLCQDRKFSDILDCSIFSDSFLMVPLSSAL